MASPGLRTANTFAARPRGRTSRASPKKASAMPTIEPRRSQLSGATISMS
ncbi:hypothetical protein HY30_07450 [Hyphomonas chukchiensis]|uniref:Uncharacterized protein n=1 Tax=Hyphomonas chukchiensis TaxID=1280947 RepID=A0A062UEE4_9PROT|nr:hypothetical protein HY30_07450 [Hyphomonas chukchiensis]